MCKRLEQEVKCNIKEAFCSPLPAEAQCLVWVLLKGVAWWGIVLQAACCFADARPGTLWVQQRAQPGTLRVKPGRAWSGTRWVWSGKGCTTMHCTPV